MRKLLATVVLGLLLSATMAGQIHTYPALDTDNTFTGANTFNGAVSIPGGISGSWFPSSAGGGTLGTAAKPWSSVFVGLAATNNIQITGTATAARTFTLPDANSNPVQPANCAANNFANGISSAGVIGCAQPTFANISGTLSLTGAVFASQGSTSTLLHGNAVGNLAFGSVALATEVAGILGQANGGTGVNSTAVFPTSGTIESGTGTTNTISKFINGAAGVQGNSSITDDGTTVSTLENFSSASISATAGTPLQALSGSSNNVQINIGRAAVEVNFAVPQSNGFFFTNSDLAAGDFVIRNQTAARRIYIGAGSAAAPVAITNTGMVFYTTSGTLPAQIQNDGGGNIQIGTSGTGPSLSIGANPFSAFSINPGTALVSNPTAGQARRGMTFGNDPAGDVTFWYNSAQTGAGIFFKDGNTSAVMAVPTGAGQLVGRDTTDTLTNKRVTPRVLLTTSSVAAPATLTADINSFDANEWNLTGTGGVLTINLPAGTPTDGQKEILRIKTTNAWTYSFNATFRFSTTAVTPTTTAAGKTDYLGIIWNALDSKWDVVAVDQAH